MYCAWPRWGITDYLRLFKHTILGYSGIITHFWKMKMIKVRCFVFEISYWKKKMFLFINIELSSILDTMTYFTYSKDDLLP